MLTRPMNKFLVMNKIFMALDDNYIKLTLFEVEKSEDNKVR